MAPLRNDDTATACVKARALMVGFAAFLLLFVSGCGKLQQKGGAPAKATRMLITERTESGGFLNGKAEINSAAAVVAAVDGMEVVAFISPTQTKDDIVTAINGDDGPNGASGKAHIRVWYSDSHGGGDENGNLRGAVHSQEQPESEYQSG
jgi:hypothetical protein